MFQFLYNSHVKVNCHALWKHGYKIRRFWFFNFFLLFIHFLSLPHSFLSLIGSELPRSRLFAAKRCRGHLNDPSTIQTKIDVTQFCKGCIENRSQHIDATVIERRIIGK